jgi:prepilin-type N-terminal cleavage/methylation domain-containing protein
MTHNETHHHRQRADGVTTGFTLMEVMVAVTIMSMIMVTIYTTLNTFLKTRDQLEIEAKAARVGPMILDLIESDLRRLWVMNIQDDEIFEGKPRILGGEHADSLVFLSTVDSIATRRINDVEIPSDLAETGYKLRVNPELPDVLELWRRQSFHIDENPLEDGYYERLYDRVISLKFRYLETLDRYAERLDSWDASERHRLPAAVEIDLVVEVVPRYVELSDDADRTLSYHRAIVLLPESNIAMRVHYLPPTFSLANIPGGGGGAGPGQGGEGEGDEGGGGDGGDIPDDPFGGGGGGGGDGGDGGGDVGDIFDELFGPGGGG